MKLKFFKAAVFDADPKTNKANKVLFMAVFLLILLFEIEPQITLFVLAVLAILELIFIMFTFAKKKIQFRKIRQKQQPAVWTSKMISSGRRR